MEITLEQVERLRARTGLSHEQARALLEEAEGDLLEALILLERRGGTGRAAGSFYSTRPDGGGEATLPAAVPGGGKQSAARDTRPGFWDQLTRLLDAVWDLLRRGVANRFEIWRKGELMCSIPVLILILLLLVAFWTSAVLFLLGLLWGCTYRLSGPDLDQWTWGGLGEQITTAVEWIKTEIRRAVEKAKNKKNN